MVAMQIFCFWFSVRFGSIITGILTLIQASVWLTLCVQRIEETEENTKEEFSEELSVFEDFIRDIQPYLTYVAAFFILLIFTCVLLLLGSLQCKPWLLYPFLVTYFLYVLVMAGLHIYIMICLKNAEYGLGDLILYSNLGGFLSLYLLYMWTCVLSFIQIIKALRSELDERKMTTIAPKQHENKGTHKIGLSHLKY